VGNKYLALLVMLFVLGSVVDAAAYNATPIGYGATPIRTPTRTATRTPTPTRTATATATPTAMPTPPVDAFQVGYTANLNVGDAFVNISNGGTQGGTEAAGGSICANIYVFDQLESMLACCACFVSPNALASISVKNQLTSNDVTPENPNSIVIKLVATQDPTGTNVSSCNASTPTFANLASGMLAWRTALHSLPTTPVSYGITETPFSKPQLSASELSNLTTTCGNLQQESGFGICKGCSVGGL